MRDRIIDKIFFSRIDFYYTLYMVSVAIATVDKFFKNFQNLYNSYLLFYINFRFIMNILLRHIIKGWQNCIFIYKLNEISLNIYMQFGT